MSGSINPNELVWDGRTIERLPDDQRVTVSHEFARVIQESGFDRTDSVRDYGRTSDKVMTVQADSRYQRHQSEAASAVALIFTALNAPTDQYGDPVPFDIHMSVFLMSHVNHVPDDFGDAGPATV